MKQNNSQFSNLIKALPWIARFGLVWGVLSLISPATHRATLQAPQTAQTINQQVCVHTSLIDEVDEWKIQRSLQLVREMGASTIVEFFPWAYIENNEDAYDWAQADRIVKHAQNQGIRIIARIGLVPAWARPGETTLNYLPEDAFPDFVDFVTDFASRYAGIIDDIIVLNEPNLAFEWGYQSVDPSRYVRLLQAVYAPVHAVNPNINILAGALAPTLEPAGSPNGLDDLLYLDAMYAAGAKAYFDALAIHTYGFTEPPDAPPSPDQLNFRRAELLRDIMRRYGDADKLVFITESGWNDDPRWTKAVRPSQRVVYTIAAFQWAQNWAWAETLCIWHFRYPRPTGRYPDNFTFVTPEFQLKPIYYALQAYARGWESEQASWLPPPGE